MKKKKMKADGVEELMEIVRAIQNGEEPEEALRRKEAESASETDSPKSRSAKGEDGASARRRKTKRENRAPEKETDDEFSKEQEEDWFEDEPKKSESAKRVKQKSMSADEGSDDFEEDDFDRNLDADGASSLNLAPVRSALEAGAGKLSGLFKGLRQRTKKEKRTDEGREREDEAAFGAEADRPETPERDAASEEEGKKAGSGVSREAVPSAFVEKQLPKPGADDEPRRRIGRLAESEFGHKNEGEAPETHVRRNVQKSTDENAESLHTDGKLPEASSEKPHEKTQDELAFDRLLDRDDLTLSEEEDGAPDAENADEAEKKEDGAAKTAGKAGRVKQALPRISVHGIRDALLDFRDRLEQKGIHRRELFMIGAGAVLVLMIVALVVNSAATSISNKKKSEHVTADDGLTVTVEKEPEGWCSSYPVELRFRTKSGTVSKITVNGVQYTPDEQGQVTVDASDYLLEAAVTTDQGELTARIEVPMIDAQAPVVSASREDDRISLKAEDARSTVSGIWYAAVPERAFVQLPLYQKYSEPIAFEADTTYYFYAEDAAGNRSPVTVTSMESAESLALGETELSLFPGETRYLQVSEEPAGALLNNLKFESANPEVATVDGNGAVTAAGNGSTVINVSADGVDAVSCTVEVSSSRSVTISAIGDCTLGTDENFNTSTSFDAFDAVNGHSYFFQNVRDILSEDDATFANFEGTLTTETAREVKEYAFKGDPSYTEILKDGSVEVVTLANNHSSDYGEKSLTDTKQYLTEAGIDYCTGDEIVLRDVNGIKTAFIGIYVLNDGMERESQVRETIASAQSQGAQLIVVAFHWGSERETQPDETQQSLAHIAVDCGADLVVGHHPHVLQGIENYNGKYIVYSLGNFCFGGNSAPSDMDTMIFRQTFTVGQDGALADGQIEIIPCSISSTAGYNNYQPTPATGSEAERILGRINEYSSAFGQSFTVSGDVGTAE